MPKVSKWKLHAKNQIKNQERNSDRTFGNTQIYKEKQSEEEIEFSRTDNFEWNNDSEWEDEDDSGWKSQENLEQENEYFKKLNKQPIELKWTKDAILEKQKRGKYMTGKLPKSTYYDKYDPSDIYTKAAEGSSKITDFLN